MLEFKTLLAFAKDSVSCMAYFYRDSWVAPPDKVESPFVHVMGEAIIRFTLYNREWLDMIGQEVVPRVDEHTEEFFEFGYELADLIIQDEPFLELLAICSLSVYIAHVFFRLGKKQFMDSAYLMIAILFMKLRNKFEAKGGWRNFQQFCLEYAMMVIREGKIKQRNSTDEYPSSSEVRGKLNPDSNQEIFIRSKSFDSLQRSTKASLKSSGFMAASTETIPKSSEIIPKSVGARLKSTVISQKPNGAIPKSTRVISKSTLKTPKYAGAQRKSTGAISKTSGAISKSTSTTRKSIDVPQKSTGAIPKSTGISQKSTGVTQKSTGAIPKSTGVTQKSTGAIPKSTGAIPKSAGVSQKTTGAIPKTTGISQKSTGAIPKSTSISQKSIGVIPKSTSITQQHSGVISKASSDVEKPVATSAKTSDKRRKKNRKFLTSESDLVSVTARLIIEDRKRVGQKSTEKTKDSPKSNPTK